MTAMVDVAFLLLTFFILTTTLASPAAMEIAKPPPVDEDNPEDEPKKVEEEKILTMILGAEDEVHYYQGLSTEATLQSTNYGPGGVRQVIVDHLNFKDNRCPKGVKAEDRPKDCWDPIFVIKPNETSRFKNLVDVLDELRIAGATKYSYTELTPADSTLLADNRKK